MDESHAVRDTPIAYQLFKHIESTKEMGVSETEATAFLGQSKLNGRAVTRNFMKASIVDYYTTNQGRQTLRRYEIRSTAKVNIRNNKFFQFH